MTACWVLHPRMIYFWRNMNISSIFYSSESTSINTYFRYTYSSLWDKMMLFTKIPHKMKMLWQNQLKILVLVSFKILYGIRYKKIDVILVQCLFKGIKWNSPILVSFLIFCHLYNKIEASLIENHAITLLMVWRTIYIKPN